VGGQLHAPAAIPQVGDSSYTYQVTFLTELSLIMLSIYAIINKIIYLEPRQPYSNSVKGMKDFP